ncbi:MAG TPA: alpha/beta fold hydrolase [Acidimicrobiales bacterium]
MTSPDAGELAVLIVHGFTGSPGTMAHLAAGIGRAGYETVVPTLPGHGTTVEDMMTTTWADWSGAAEAAYLELAARSDRVAVVGLSMGGTITCWLAARHPEIAGIVCVNPFVLPRDPDEIAFIDALVEAGDTLTDGVGADIADPDVVEPAYDQTPLVPLRSLVGAVTDLQPELERIACPLLLLTSAEDHTVDPLNSDHLANQVVGPVDRVRLERSYHVAVLDYDKDVVVERTLDFLRAL